MHKQEILHKKKWDKFIDREPKQPSLSQLAFLLWYRCCLELRVNEYTFDQPEIKVKISLLICVHYYAFHITS